MPKYYLHLQTDGLVEDFDAGEYADLDAARCEAVIAAREILGGRLRVGEPLNGSAIEICDADGKLLATVAFKDAFKLNDSWIRSAFDGPWSSTRRAHLGDRPTADRCIQDDICVVLRALLHPA